MVSERTEFGHQPFIQLYTSGRATEQRSARDPRSRRYRAVHRRTVAPADRTISAGMQWSIHRIVVEPVGSSILFDMVNSDGAFVFVMEAGT